MILLCVDFIFYLFIYLFIYFAFIEYILAGKNLLDYTKLFSPNEYKNNDKITYKYFKASSSDCVLIFVFAPLVCVPAGINSSVIGLNMCAIIAGIKNCKSIIKKKKKKHDKIVLLGKAKLDAIEILISEALIDSYISHDEFFSVNNVLREYNK